MKKFFMISILMGALPLSMVAQDDLYFVPKKKRAEVVEVTTPINNRMKSQYEVIQNDSTNDIIEFDGQKGIYPDSLAEDFELTKKMQRFDDYDLSDNAAFWAGYHLGRDTWGWSWHSPWYYNRYGWYGGWYDPWYYGYYDPWYYGYYGWRDPWYYGYYDPFYYGYYGWYDPWRYGYYGYYDLGYPYYTTVYYGGAPRRYSAYTGNTGTINRNGSTHGYFAGDRSKASRTYSSSVNGSRSSSLRNRTVGEHRSRINDSSNSSIRNSRSSNSGNFSGSRSTSSYSNSTSSYSNSGSSRSSSGGSFSSGGGGSFSSGGGGGRSGGGSLGGRR